MPDNEKLKTKVITRKDRQIDTGKDEDDYSAAKRKIVALVLETIVVMISKHSTHDNSMNLIVVKMEMALAIV